MSKFVKCSGWLLAFGLLSACDPNVDVGVGRDAVASSSQEETERSDVADPPVADGQTPAPDPDGEPTPQ